MDPLLVTYLVWFGVFIVLAIFIIFFTEVDKKRSPKKEN